MSLKISPSVCLLKCLPIFHSTYYSVCVSLFLSHILPITQYALPTPLCTFPQSTYPQSAYHSVYLSPIGPIPPLSLPIPQV